MYSLMMKDHWTVATPFRWLVWWYHFRGGGVLVLDLERLDMRNGVRCWDYKRCYQRE